jgi:folate-binding protein YgfZ
MADLERDLVRASADEAEAWRIGAGIPRVGIDTAEGDLPQEAALERAVSFDKGCFVGQEAVAKTRNLGHPRRVLVALSTDDEVATGDPVVTDEGDAGSITSAARIGERTFALARVRWSDRDRAFRTRAGVPLELAG